ncbi:MAG: alanyl-tRNA editing protein [Oscillospiraceae bacterium]|nr:alanyl-tRNA editing protein [Oscillospiraceae bacterium]
METRKLYYEDCLLREFSATVTGCVPAENGYLITLDATAFYPEGGGQACDLGTLGDSRVLDVQERDSEVQHLCDKPLTVGSTVTGQLDWERRFDLMQQHAGEHILSGLIHRRFGYHNVGFHVGQEVLEVDFDGPIPAEALTELETLANQAVWENLPVRCWIPSAQELPDVHYRRKRELPWPVRIVEFPGYDACACCGVHVAYTGQIGLIKILSCVKFHQGVRLEMVCGKRAYDHLCRVYEQNRQISQLLSSKPLETAPAVRQLQERLGAEKYRCSALEKRMFAAIAAGYQGIDNPVHFEEGLSSAALRELTDAIASTCSGIAAVFSGTDAEGYSFCLISSREDVSGLGNALTQELGGRGGGRSGAFQGSIKATRQEIAALFDRFCRINGL